MKFRVPIFGSSNRFAWLDESANEGATVGKDLKGPDSKLVTTEQWREMQGGSDSSSAAAGGTTDGIEEGRYNLYFTDERAQDAVGHILLDSPNVSLFYDDGRPGIKADLTDVTVSAGGVLKKYGFDVKGRLAETDDATTDDLSEGASNLYFTNARVDARITRAKGQPDGIASLLGGKLDPGQLPPLAITDTYVVNTEAAMLALSAEAGDVAVRTDESKSYILTATPASALANWQQLLTPTSPVTSVFGRTGPVTAASGDYTFAQIANTPTTLTGYGVSEADQIIMAGAPITASAAPFFTGDGVTTQAPITYNGHVVSNPTITAIHQTDWQGRVELSDQPRTNEVPEFSNWAYPNGATYAGTALHTPAGDLHKVTCAATSNSQLYYSYASTEGSPFFCFTVLAKGTDGSQTRVGFYNGVGQGFAAEVFVTWASGVPTLSGSVGTPDATLASLGDGAYLLSFSGTYGRQGSTSPRFILTPDLHWNAGSVYVGMPMLTTERGAYIPTTDAPVTVTDYVVGASGITFGQAPAGESSPGAGDAAVVDWTGSGTTNPDSVSRLGPPTAARSFGGYRATNLADPVAPQDAATKQAVADAVSAAMPGTFTVASLPATAQEGARAFATDGRKTGEDASAGTGVPVYFSANKWRLYRDDSEVVA